jgi:heterodisulfide reductase subunit C2
LQSKTEPNPECNEVKVVSEQVAPKRSRLDFVHEVEKLPGGDRILECIQCGVCSGGCPTRYSMDYSPTQIIKMITLGMREEVLSSYTIWKCSSCYTCYSRCPRGIDFTTLMMSLKNLSLKENLAKSTVKPKFHKGFNDIVTKYGRLSEALLTTKTLDKSDPKAIMHTASLGVRLARKGKIGLKPAKIGHTADLETMHKAINGEKKR